MTNVSQAGQIKGLELARQYYTACRPLLFENMPDIMRKAAAGLVGEGSECFGCDDQYSRDHDFGPAFCLWLPDDLLAAEKERINAALAALPKTFTGMPCRLNCRGRTGALGIRAFYAFLTGLDQPPQNWREWLGLKEERAAVAVNGEIFEDNAGQFSAWRKTLLAFYPQDVWRKKLCARVMNMAQAGQYNLPRTLQREDAPAAMLARDEFARAALSFVFLLNRRYMPFYKWAPCLCRNLPVLGPELHDLLCRLAAWPLGSQHDMEIVNAIEEFCQNCAAALQHGGLSNCPGAWLWEHGPAIMAAVQTPELLRMDLLHDEGG